MGHRGIRWAATLALALNISACGSSEPAPVVCEHTPENMADFPWITGMEPESGVPGTTVILTGTNFDRIDDRYQAVYADFSEGCDFATLEGKVLSSTEIEVIIPDDATASGFIYLSAESLTVTRTPRAFELDAVPRGTVVVQNTAQFPIVTAKASWESILDPGDRVDVAETREFEIPSGPMLLELCLGGPGADGALEPWACQTYSGNLQPGETVDITVEPAPAARFLAGEWEATWEVDEETTAKESLRIYAEGAWELRFDGRVVENGTVQGRTWAPYDTNFSFALRPEDQQWSDATLPVRAFRLYSPRAQAEVSFFRAE